jgi:hypothetical protein
MSAVLVAQWRLSQCSLMGVVFFVMNSQYLRMNQMVLLTCIYLIAYF